MTREVQRRCIRDTQRYLLCYVRWLNNFSTFSRSKEKRQFEDQSPSLCTAAIRAVVLIIAATGTAQLSKSLYSSEENSVSLPLPALLLSQCTFKACHSTGTGEKTFSLRKVRPTYLIHHTETEHVLVVAHCSE